MGLFFDNNKVTNISRQYSNYFGVGEGERGAWCGVDRPSHLGI